MSLGEQAYYRIRELIVTLELAPGSPVSERELMERLGLGRTPVREALRTLAQERLVEVYPRRGIFVSPRRRRRPRAALRGQDHARELRRAPRRRARERTTTARSPWRSSPSCPRLADTRDERALIELDQRIHRHIYRCAHNPFLESTLNEYYMLTLRIWFLALDRVARLDDAVTEHAELLQAICDGDAARAEAVMRHHIEAFERAIRAVL